MKKFKKLLVAMIAIIIISATFIGCNMELIDTTYSYERVILSLPNGQVVEGKCTKWSDYENSDMIQVTIDGKTYLTHASNVVLISE